MAEMRYNFAGPVIILPHEDVQQALQIIAGSGSAVATFAVIFPPLAPVAVVLVPYLALEASLIEKLDAGNGVYLTMPWITPGVIIPTTRPDGIGLPPGWASRTPEEFRTEDAADRLTWEIVHHAVAEDAVEFQLSSDRPRMWGKALVIRDGLGGEWNVSIDPSRGVSSAANGLWAHQVNNGQHLSLWKAKEFGRPFWVLDIHGLGGLQPGDRVDFRWLAD